MRSLHCRDFCCGSSLSQAKTISPALADTPWSQEMNKYPGLLPEFWQAREKLKEEIQYPARGAKAVCLALFAGNDDVLCRDF